LSQGSILLMSYKLSLAKPAGPEFPDESAA